MDQQTTTAAAQPAQSSIRSFFQPLLSPQTSKPPVSLSRSQLHSAPPLSTPPPILPSSSYASSPNHPTPTPSQPRNQTTNTTLPLEASILPIHKDHIVALRRINSLLLPISYPDSFYHAILQPSSPAQTNFSRVITWEGKVIGGIVCRLDPSLPSSPSPFTSTSLPKHNPDQDSSEEREYDIYIQSLCLLSPYRSKGLIRAAFEDILLASTIESKISSLKIKGLYAHVWTSNQEALQWYKNRSFTIYDDGVVNGYYRRLKPDTAYIMRRELTISDHLSTPSPPKTLSSSTARTSPPPPPSNTPLQSHPPVSKPSPKRPAAPLHSRSFQDVGPAREWNDLPEDVLIPSARVHGLLSASAAASATSSRSNSQVRGEKSEKVDKEKAKKKRVYPSAAFAGPPA